MTVLAGTAQLFQHACHDIPQHTESVLAVQSLAVDDRDLLETCLLCVPDE